MLSLCETLNYGRINLNYIPHVSKMYFSVILQISKKWKSIQLPMVSVVVSVIPIPIPHQHYHPCNARLWGVKNTHDSNFPLLYLQNLGTEKRSQVPFNYKYCLLCFALDVLSNKQLFITVITDSTEMVGRSIKILGSLCNQLLYNYLCSYRYTEDMFMQALCNP